MKSNKTVRGIITQKTKSYLVLSTSLLLCLIITLSTVVISSLCQHLQEKENYYDNLNTHIIEIDSKNENSQYSSLTFNDIQTIKNITLEVENCEVWTEYRINFGINVSNNDSESFFIYSYDSELYNEIDLLFDSDSICYSSNTSLANKNIELSIPIIQTCNGGYSSVESFKIMLNCKPLNNTKLTFLDSTMNNNSNIFVNYSLFSRIISQMFNDSDDNIKNFINTGKDLGIVPINKIFLYSSEIDNIEYFASQVGNMGFNTNYAFEYFDDMSGKLKTSRVLEIISIILCLLMTAFNLIASYEIFFSSLQKDMGILKHYGYSCGEIFYIYNSGIIKTTFIIGVITTSFNVIFSRLFIVNNGIIYGLIISFVELVFVIIIYIIVCVLLNSKCKKPTINLLLHSRNFE